MRTGTPLAWIALHALLTTLLACDVPVVATPDGYSGGGGAEDGSSAGAEDAADEPDAVSAQRGWTTVFSDLPEAALAAWGTAADDLWVVGADQGNGPLLRQWDGSTWRDHTTGTSGDLWWASTPDDATVVFVGEAGTILRYERATETFTLLEQKTTSTLYGVWGTGEGNLYAVGGDPLGAGGPVVLHIEGDLVEEVTDLPATLPAGATLFKVWGSAADDVWAVGTEGAMLHFDGDAWAATPFDDGPWFITLDGHGPDDLVVVGGKGQGLIMERRDGGDWTDVSPEAYGGFNGVFVTEDAAVVVGEFGAALERGPGGAWSDLPTAPVYAAWHATRIDEAGNTWLVGGDLIDQDEGAVLCYGTSCPSGDIVEPAGSTPASTDVGGGDTATPEREWSTVFGDLDRAALAIWGTGPSDLWIVGADQGDGPLIRQWTGLGWLEHSPGTSGDLWWAVTPDADTAFFVGEGGVLLRYDRATDAFSLIETPTSLPLFGVWGASASEVWAVGGDPAGVGGPVVLRYDGATAAEVTDLPAGVSAKARLFKVWGSAAEDVWVVGTEGTMLHFDGAQWTRTLFNDNPYFVTINGDGPDDIVVVGGKSQALLLERSAGAWSEVDLGFTASLNGTYVADGVAVAVGNFGTALERDADGVWADLPEVPDDLLAHSWHGARIDGAGNTWIVGGDLFAQDEGAVACYGTSCPSGASVEPATSAPVAPPMGVPDAEVVDDADAGSTPDDGPGVADADDVGPDLMDIGPDIGPDVPMPADVPADTGGLWTPDGLGSDNEFALEIGTGDDLAAFQPLTPYQEMEVIQGPQGGIHIEFTFHLETQYSKPQLYAGVVGRSYIDGLEVGFTQAPQILITGGAGHYFSKQFFIQFYEDDAAVVLGDPPQTTWVTLCIEVTLSHDELPDPPDVSEVCQIISAIDTVNEQLEGQ